MSRIKDTDVERDILLLLSDGKARSMRQIQRELGREWNAIYYHLRGKENNLVARRCVEEEKTYGELSRFAQDEYIFKKGPEFDRCLAEKL
jgi:predicted transcriptional regulator